MRELRTKVALVTGAGSGIGRATALALAEEGMRLVLCDVNEEGLREAESEVNRHSACLLARVVDVSDPRAMELFAKEVHALTPAVDVLVNNAGIGMGGTILDLSLEDWDRVLSINLRGVVHGCHYFIPPMVERKAGGHVVNVSSAFGFMAVPGSISYATAKFGVFGLSEAMRLELAEHRIGVTCICPGVIATNILNTTTLRTEGDREKLRELMTRFYRWRNYGPEKVARAILRSIRSNRGVTPVSPEAWVSYYIKRFFPWMTHFLSGRLYRRLRKEALNPES